MTSATGGRTGSAEGRWMLIPRAVVDGVTPEPLEHTAVFVAGEHVEAVVPLREATRSRRGDATVVEAPHATLMPGLIDCHTHLVFDRYPSMQAIDSGSVESATLTAAGNAGLLVRHGYTTVRDVGSRGAASLAVGDAVRRGRLAGPRVLAGAELISTTAGTADSYPTWISNSAGVGVVVDGVDELRHEVRRQRKLGAHHVKLGLSGSEPSVYSYTWMTTMSEDEVATAIAEAHRLGMRVACHSEAEASSEYAARHGADTIEHGTRLTELAADLMVSNGCILVPTLCTLHSVLDRGEELGLGAKQREEMAVNREPWLASVTMAREKGIPIAAGGDVGNRYRHGENARELQHLAEAGLTPMEALQAATSVAASALGWGNRLGRVAPGFIADLVLFEGDPCETSTSCTSRSGSAG